MSKTYTTVQGDKWDSIAHKLLGSTDHTDKLMNANPKFRDVYMFPSGVTLVIPEVSRSAGTDLPPWKKVSG